MYGEFRLISNIMNSMESLLGQPVPGGAPMVGSNPGSQPFMRNYAMDPSQVRRQSQTIQNPPMYSGVPPNTVQQIRARVPILLFINQELLKQAIVYPRGSERFNAAMKHLQYNLGFLQTLKDPMAVYSGNLPPIIIQAPPEFPNLVEAYSALGNTYKQ